MDKGASSSFKVIFKDALAPHDRASVWLMLCAVCMPVLYWYQGTPGFYQAHFSTLQAELPTIQAQLWRFCAAFLLFFLIPAVGWRLLSGKSLAHLGLCPGDWRVGLKLAAVAILVASPGLWISAASPEMQRTYPMAVEAPTTLSLFAIYELAYGLYYWGWEFFFRGALQLGLMPALGFSGAMMVQWLPSVMIHFEKPLAETWGAVVVGPLLGAASVRTRSFLHVFLFHYAIGIINDIFCAIRQGMI